MLFYTQIVLKIMSSSIIDDLSCQYEYTLMSNHVGTSGGKLLRFPLVLHPLVHKVFLGVLCRLSI